MKHSALILLLAASTVAASAQAPAKPATPAAKPATTAAKPAATADKLPPGVPVVKTIKKTLFTLRYQEIKVGAGAVAEPNKIYSVFYTGWLGANGRADDGRKFDSSDDHRLPLKDKEGKPVMGEDGKPKLDVPQPMPFPQGFRRVIPGFDQGFEGMKIGGKRRIFIPWQLAYGAMGSPGPDAAHPGIPPKADLIFDVELVDVADLPMPANHPPMGGMRQMPGAPRPGAQETPAQPGTAPAATTPVPPPAPPK
jgi:peptidylprolyl isomerase